MDVAFQSVVRRRLVPVVVLSILTVAGCRLYFETESVELVDASTDASTGGDTTRDLSDTTVDAPDSFVPPDGTGDVGPVRECEADVRAISGCNPEGRPGVCSASERCTPNSRGSRTVCIAESAFGTTNEGKACDISSSERVCAAGLDCVDWSVANTPDPRSAVCSRVCSVQSGRLCPDGWFCTNPFGMGRLAGVGYCTRTCDPYDTNSCGANADCSPDPNFVRGKTCLPRFRCVSAKNIPNQREGVECSLDNLGENGCGDDRLVCAPIPDKSGSYCVEPCDSENDCSTECIESNNAWDLRYCAFGD